MNNDVQYREYGIVFENYIVSTGFKKMIEGSQIARYVKKIWGAELIDQADLNGNRLQFGQYNEDPCTL